MDSKLLEADEWKDKRRSHPIRGVGGGRGARRGGRRGRGRGRGTGSTEEQRTLEERLKVTPRDSAESRIRIQARNCRTESSRESHTNLPSSLFLTQQPSLGHRAVGITLPGPFQPGVWGPLFFLVQQEWTYLPHSGLWLPPCFPEP